MADFISTTPSCLPAEVYRLYLRILGGLLLGNTDMHFKNFAMLHTSGGFRLSPSYDQVAAALYDYKTIALAIGGVSDLSWSDLKAKSLVRLGEDFGLSAAAIRMAHEKLAKRKDAMLDTINENEFAPKRAKDDLIKLVKRRWNGTFSLIGRALSKKR
jgi:serine/threonine-protein kinase HipA